MGQPDRLGRLSLLSRVRALRLRSARDATGLHYVEGIRNVFHALEADIPVQTIVYSEVLAPPFAQKRVRLARRDGVPVARVTPEEFRSVSTAHRASGVGAILRQHWSPLEQADSRRGLCWIAVGLVRLPGNLGTLLRTADAVGAAGVIFLTESTDPFDADVVRASMGGIFRLGLVRATLDGFCVWARRGGCNVVGTSPAGSVLYTEVTVDTPLVLLFGDERKGLSSEELGACGQTARIPIAGRADSLNVGVAAGVILYDVLRRRLSEHR